MLEAGKIARIVIGKGILFINEVPANLAPPHFDLAGLLGLITKDFAKEHMFDDESERVVLMAKLFSRAVIGGYVQSIDGVYRFTEGAKGIPPASDKDFKKLYKPNTVIYTSYVTADIFKK